jgi:hypothetical protein
LTGFQLGRYTRNMNDAFELLDPQNAREFLTRFDLASRRKGEFFFRKGRVEALVAEKAAMAYAGVVKDGEPNEVDLYYDEVEGWAGCCTCDQGERCPHVFAAMRALLAEHSTAAVRNLSAGVSSAGGARAKAGKEESEAGGLARRLMAAVGRPLNAEETKFIRRVDTVYTRCVENRRITYWDFDEMGLRLGGHGWNALQIWPAFPANQHEFWLYVANAAKQHEVAIPEFMAPVTELDGVRHRLARWQRAREVEHWKQALGKASSGLTMQRATSLNEIDLRLVIGPDEALLQWRRGSPQESFQPIKPAYMQQLNSEFRQGLVQFTGHAELLWNFFSQRFMIGAPMLRYQDVDAAELLRRILRIAALEAHVVNAEGQPLARVAAPLRWELVAGANEEEDYRLRLVQQDGTAPPPIICIMPGNPTVYLTANTVFIGPPSRDDVLDPRQESRIPTPAIESNTGLAFIQSLGLEMPPRLRERIQTLTFQLAIDCRLRPIYPGSSTEDCVVSVVAEAPDGYQQTWTGYTWLDGVVEQRRSKKRNDALITLYDRSVLDPIPSLLAPLNLKPVALGGAPAARVSRKFPEVFAAWLKTIPPHIPVHLEGELASLAKAEVAGQVSLDVTETEIDWFDLRVVLNVTDTTLTPEEVKLLLNAKGGYVRLAGKGWRRLQFDLSEDENERLARLGLSPRGLTAEPQRLHALQLADDAAKKFLPEAQVEQIQRRASEIKTRVAPELPAGVRAELRPYQLEGFHFLAYLSTNHFGGILADDMGLGKTLQTLAWLLWLQQEEKQVAVPKSEGTRPGGVASLVVCPKSVMDNWQAEAARFTPSLRVKVWSAGELERLPFRLGEADLHVINYNQLRLLGETLVAVRWRAVILDEGQYIKNPSSQTAQVARALRTGQRLVLSGTPIENRLLDLWSLMAFAMPGVLGSRAQFARLYDGKGDPFARRRLASRVRPFLVRRTKSQVAKDLPDRIEEDLYCEIEGEQKTLYRAELKRAQQMLLRIKTQKELAQQQFHFLTSLLRLRQICCHPRLVDMNSTGPSAKSEALLEQLEPLMDEGQKVLVFSQFVELLGLLRPLLAEREWPMFYLAGETENRGELVKQFQSAEGPAVFLISLKAGGFGLNLTAASYVVLFDPWWNPAVENQAIDRTHRIGQTNKVIAYRLLIKNSIEEKIRALQKQKQVLAEDVLGEEKFSQGLSLQDFQFLFAD